MNKIGMTKDQVDSLNIGALIKHTGQKDSPVWEVIAVEHGTLGSQFDRYVGVHCVTVTRGDPRRTTKNIERTRLWSYALVEVGHKRHISRLMKIIEAHEEEKRVLTKTIKKLRNALFRMIYNEHTDDAKAILNEVDTVGFVPEGRCEPEKNRTT